MWHNIVFETKEDLLMLVLGTWIFFVVARVFMISLEMVLERLENCTIFVKNLWHEHVLNYEKLIYEFFIYQIPM